ncbi:MAG: hypothetical protein J3Q66DRAFT_421645 [Benniella sp.]|nr:MAG: hypothetical protein J3Q66DRAFT_421645 [Benniella sp.]
MTTADRSRSAERKWGLFVNTLALRIDVSGKPTVQQLLERVRKTSLDAQNHQDLPFEQFVDIVHPPRSLSYSPLFQVMFVLLNNERSEWHLPGLEDIDANASYGIAKFDLTLGLYESGNGITGGMSYSTALFDRTTVERHVGYLRSMLQAVVGDVDRPAMSVELLSKIERDLVLGQWNETQQDYPADQCIHHLFEQQVERTSLAIALVFNGQLLAYGELNERANRLAHQLIGLGVRPGIRVEICVERSIAMIAGVQVSWLRTAAGDDSLSLLTVVDLDAMDACLVSKSVKARDPLDNPKVPGLTSHNLVYMIYTSGSTGKPKGVMVEHQGLVNMAKTSPEAGGISESSHVLQFFSFTFDACAMDVFTTQPLCNVPN